MTRHMNRRGYSVGQRVRNLRLQHGLSQFDLSHPLKVREIRISELERDASRVNCKSYRDLIAGVAEFFKVSEAYLLHGDESERDPAPVPDPERPAVEVQYVPVFIVLSADGTTWVDVR